MASPIMYIDADASISDAARLMQEKKIGSLLVKSNNEYVGIVTETDFTRKVLGKGLKPETTEVTKVMTAPILSMEKSELITEANQFMAKNKVRHLGVTENGKMVGILSVRDLVHFFANPRLRTW
ncbi:hypothetical protein UR09_02600 [Candidatus Nitromaritima sp. SCGC AAA799-A02]|nr:hypothetical protein UR09_02600 [Candidatus Nitromaritima sp. SCGC AAA799-A02]KMP11894.1 hypothetical protein UZ36_02825 [Candidatus Nitromaritima sp. SCGC AAA799-C22]